MADSTARGIDSFRAQEKSTIKTDIALDGLLVRSHVSSVPPKLQGTRVSAREAAFPSNTDFSFSDSSIMAVILSNRVEPEVFFTTTVRFPSSVTVPA